MKKSCNVPQGLDKATKSLKKGKGPQKRTQKENVRRVKV